LGFVQKYDQEIQAERDSTYMDKKITLLDCTLRDGAYIVDSRFGDAAIVGIIQKLRDAGIDVIECGWLKDPPHQPGSSFFHVPADAKPYIPGKYAQTLYAAMIDWDRYQVEQLPQNDGSSIDAIRVVFPHGKCCEGAAVGKVIREKGYQVLFQAANTLAYSDDDLRVLAETVNAVNPLAVSIVDTFGAMYAKDLDRIAAILDKELDPGIRLGFHSHNNQQLSFALSMHFADYFQNSERKIMIDASLCGMGRGAGNTATELLASYLNRNCHGSYDMDVILDAIDTYMTRFSEQYSWGYSAPYLIAGMYCCHVNNIAYLQKNHRTNAKDMRNIIAALSPEDRRKYDYELLEQKYLENQSRTVNDEAVMQRLKTALQGKRVLLIAPGKSTVAEAEKIQRYIAEYHPVVIAVNAVNPNFSPDYLFIINAIRYQYAKEVYPDCFAKSPKILLSSIKTSGEADEWIVNFSRVTKRGWTYFDNAVIDCLRLLSKLSVYDVAVAGFDGFKTKYNESYADAALPTLNPNNDWGELNREITDMFSDFKASAGRDMVIRFITESIFDTE